MHPKQFESVRGLRPSERYSYFVRKVADSEQLWSLYDDGWAVMADDDGTQVYPFWPEREFAESLATGPWASYVAKSVSLDEFLDKWIQGMADNGIRPAIFPIVKGKGVVVEPSRLAEDLKAETQQYE